MKPQLSQPLTKKQTKKKNQNNTYKSSISGGFFIMFKY